MKKVDLLDRFDNSWYAAFGKVVMKKGIEQIAKDVAEDRVLNTVYPEEGSETMFNAFNVTPLEGVKVVVLGQDPYHDGSYNGLAFGNGKQGERAVKKISPSLRNVIKEVERTHTGKVHPSLYPWAEQGVLLINTAHTVREKDAGSHLHIWTQFTHLTINALNTKSNVIWMLWGAKAHDFGEYITNPTHALIKTGHPSPLNRTNPFIGSGCFDKCDKELASMGHNLIKWTEL